MSLCTFFDMDKKLSNWYKTTDDFIKSLSSTFENLDRKGF